MRRIAISVGLTLIGAGLLAAPAQATFHLNAVNEVMLASSTGDVSSQFVEFLDKGGTEEQFPPVFAPYKLVVYDAAGNELGEQILNPAGLRAAAAAGREYLVSSPSVDAAFGVAGDERLTVSLPPTAGQVCFAGSEPAPPAVSCMTYGTITKAVSTNSFGTGLAHGPVPPNGESDQRRPDGTVIAASPTPKAQNRSAITPPPPGKSGKPVESHVALTGIAKRKAKLSFKLLAGSNAPGLAKIVVGLPRGLSSSPRRLAHGVAVKGPGGKRLKFSVRRSKGRLTVKLNSAASEVAIRIGRPVITVSGRVAAGVRKHEIKTLIVGLKVTDTNGTVTKFVSHLTAR